jgi:hypothetical protein
MSKEIQFEKSFASNEKSKYWSNKNKLKPNEVSKSSNKNIYLIVIYVITNLKVH